MIVILSCYIRISRALCTSAITTKILPNSKLTRYLGESGPAHWPTFSGLIWRNILGAQHVLPQKMLLSFPKYLVLQANITTIWPKDKKLIKKINSIPWQSGGPCTFTTTPPQSTDCARGKPDGAILTEDYWWVTVLITLSPYLSLIYNTAQRYRFSRLKHSEAIALEQGRLLLAFQRKSDGCRFEAF